MGATEGLGLGRLGSEERLGFGTYWGQGLET